MKEKKMQQHYIVGDVHGEYKTLLALVALLPNNARLIFVGDLVNRGSQTKEVIEFVRQNAFYAVRGNHEEYFLKYGHLFLDMLANKEENSSLIWSHRMLPSTLRSYGLLALENGEIISDQEAIEAFKKDMEWIESLSIAYEFGQLKGYSLPVVVTHAPVDRYWIFKESHPNYFAFFAMNNRGKPSKEAPIFNIHGHIPHEEVLFGMNYVNVDTGCGRGNDRALSAYCVETKEVVTVPIVI